MSTLDPHRITDHRRRAGITRAGLAQRIDRTEAQVGRIETGARQPTVATLGRIADVLGVSVGDLFDNAPVSL